jgi:hypothetical protein
VVGVGLLKRRFRLLVRDFLLGVLFLGFLWDFGKVYSA